MVAAVALQLLHAARAAQGVPPAGTFSDPEKVGAICKPSFTGWITELHQDEGCEHKNPPFLV